MITPKSPAEARRMLLTGAINQLDKASVASCGCGTKTPDHAFHKEGCLYRTLQEARLDIEAAMEIEPATATPEIGQTSR